MRAAEEVQTSDPTDQVATFDIEKFAIPKGAILGLGVSFTNDKNPVVEPSKYYVQAFLIATVNLMNVLIAQNRCGMFFTLVADTLSSLNVGDTNIEPYKEAGDRYVAENQRYLKITGLNKDQVLCTRWDEWKNNSVLAPFLNRCLTVNEADGVLVRKRSKTSLSTKVAATTFEEFRALFDDTKCSASEKSFDKLVPSYEIALQYIRYMFDSVESPNHKEFHKALDANIGDHVRTAVSSYKKNLGLGKDVEIPVDEKNKLVTNKREFLMHECAQYLELGIIARQINRPIRIFHQGHMSLAFEYIDKFLIGYLPNNIFAIQVVDMSFVKQTKAERFFKQHLKFFNPTVQRISPRNGKHAPKVTQNDPDDLLFHALTYLTSDNTPVYKVRNVLKLLEKAIRDKRKQLNTSSQVNAGSPPRSYTFDSSSPSPEELLVNLTAYFNHSSTKLHVLEAFHSNLTAHLTSQNSSEESPVSSPSDSPAVDRKSRELPSSPEFSADNETEASIKKLN